MKPAKKPEGPATTSSSTSIAPAAIYTAASLVERYGRAAEERVVVYVRGVPRAELVKSGRRVATSRVVRDGARVVGQAGDFLATATPAQRRLLATVTPGFLSAVSTGLLAAQELDAKVQRRRARRAARRVAAKTDVARTVGEARPRRLLFRAHLVAMAAGDATWVARVDAACGAAPDEASLADSIDAMVVEARALTAHARAQGAEVTVDAEYLAEMTALAAKVRDAADESSTAAAPGGVDQATLDWWDGVNLWFLRAIYDEFARAHEVDPTVPRVSLLSLRNVVRPRGQNARKARKPAPPAPPSPPPVG